MEYQIVNADGMEIEKHLDPFFKIANLFAQVVWRAKDHARLYGRPVRIMGHFPDADDAHRFQSELYVAQP